MPKVVLLNSESGKLEDFEPVDAKEALANKNTIYRVPPTADNPTQEITLIMGNSGGNAAVAAAASAAGVAPEAIVNVPQLQGNDAEMQLGLSIEKYGRSAVVQAQPGNPTYVPIGEDTSDPQFQGRSSSLGRSTAGPSDEQRKSEIRSAERHVEDLKDAQVSREASAKALESTADADHAPRRRK